MAATQGYAPSVAPPHASLLAVEEPCLRQRTRPRPPRCWAEAAAAHVPAGAGGHMTYARVRARRAHERARVRRPEPRTPRRGWGSGRRDAAAVPDADPCAIILTSPSSPRKAIGESLDWRRGDSLGFGLPLLHAGSISECAPSCHGFTRVVHEKKNPFKCSLIQPLIRTTIVCGSL